jgi:succinate dehydrogenase iron-sulfur subunit
MFQSLQKVHGWIDAENYWDQGEGPKMSQKAQEVRYALSTCMTCGCCSEGCPQVNEKSKFMGPAPISQVRLFNSHPSGKMHQRKRLRALMSEEGLNGCGNAQNCVRVCPKNIPLTDSIAAMGRDITFEAFRELFSLPERE